MPFAHIALLLLLTAVPHTLAAVETNAGFVDGLWYETEPVFAGKENGVYVAIRNNTRENFTGTIYFTDNDTAIGSVDVRAEKGRLVEARIDWTPTEGEHRLIATLRDVVGETTRSSTEPLFGESVTLSSTIVVVNDTDDDGVGDPTDEDDDNDSRSDEVERAEGTDPLIPNQVSTATEQKTADDDETNGQASESSSSNIANRQGLERFLDDGVTNLLLRNVTEKVERAKSNLDDYRSERNATLEEKLPEEVMQSTEGTGAVHATITRSKIETKESFTTSLLSGVRGVLQTVWTFVLFILSKVLGHPALIQILLLLFILYLLYRTARRLGRRSYN